MVASYASKHVVYRGEDHVKYELRPKFGRHQASIRKDPIGTEKEILAEFKRRARPYVTYPPEDEWEWLSLAQHFGLATRLLDWTRNPLVAAFFATPLPGARSDRVIYVLDRAKVATPVPSKSPFDIEKVTLFRPVHADARISAQAGLFTLHPSPEQAFESEGLDRWVIKEAAIIKLAITLDGFGFNRETMFPGMDGVAFHINDWHLRGLRDDLPKVKK